MSPEDSKQAQELLDRIEQVIVDLPSDEILQGIHMETFSCMADLERVIEEYTIPSEATLSDIQTGVVTWIRANAPEFVAAIAVLSPYPVRWSSGPDAWKTEVCRRRILLENIARLLSEAVEIAERNVTVRTVRPKPPLTDYERKILAVLKRGVRGKRFCEVCNSEGIPPHPLWPPKWPGDWLKAYCDKTGEDDWQKLIQDLVHRVRRKADLPRRTRRTLASE